MSFGAASAEMLVVPFHDHKASATCDAAYSNANVNAGVRHTIESIVSLDLLSILVGRHVCQIVASFCYCVETSDEKTWLDAMPGGYKVEPGTDLRTGHAFEEEHIGYVRYYDELHIGTNIPLFLSKTFPSFFQVTSPFYVTFGFRSSYFGVGFCIESDLNVPTKIKFVVEQRMHEKGPITITSATIDVKAGARQFVGFRTFEEIESIYIVPGPESLIKNAKNLRIVGLYLPRLPDKPKYIQEKLPLVPIPTLGSLYSTLPFDIITSSSQSLPFMSSKSTVSATELIFDIDGRKAITRGRGEKVIPFRYEIITFQFVSDGISMLVADPLNKQISVCVKITTKDKNVNASNKIYRFANVKVDDMFMLVAHKEVSIVSVDIKVMSNDSLFLSKFTLLNRCLTRA